MPQSVVLYHRYGSLEWATRYYVSGFGGSTHSGRATALAGAEQPLVTPDISFSRWEILDAAGAKINEGSFTLIVGTAAGTVMPIHYALLVRLNSTGPGRPSVKYLHGYSEDAVDNGLIDTATLTALNIYGADLVGEGVVDSDGVAITGVSFRSFTRRKRMRQVEG